MEGQFTLTKFKGLTAADQSAVRAQKKMDDYLSGLVSICEVNTYIHTYTHTYTALCCFPLVDPEPFHLHLYLLGSMLAVDELHGSHGSHPARHRHLQHVPEIIECSQ